MRMTMREYVIVGIFALIFFGSSLLTLSTPIAQLLTSPAQNDTVNISTNVITFYLSGDTLTLPYYRNKRLMDSHPECGRAVVMVHGTSRNADHYYEDVLLASANDVGAEPTTILIAPQFLCRLDTSLAKYQDDMLFWTYNNDWKRGDHSSAAHPDSISSFAVMDTILYRLAVRNPNLDTIVVAGHSAGGQYVNRYSVGSKIHDFLDTYDIHLRHVVANPSSYVYVDSFRAEAGTVDSFVIPPDTCVDYNEYKYGLDDFGRYSQAYMWGQTKSELREQLSEKWVVYFLGQADSLYEDSLDDSCSAWLQGRHRLNRGEIYYNHILFHYGSWIHCKQTKIIVPGVDHDGEDMYRSSEGHFVLFDVGHATPWDCHCMWVDFSYLGPPFDGSFQQPYDSLATALLIVPEAGTIMMKGGSTLETPIIDQSVFLRSWQSRASVGR